MPLQRSWLWRPAAPLRLLLLLLALDQGTCWSLAAHQEQAAAAA
jgi:hypothetical protein